ncbi:putative glycosyltransferase At5g03795 isoform X2 [Tasmannia lanceolata]|uniref:putative glycosyltransferase At5g03795 isoform X2 n=1 Tax=Tasmannia lanceolata TaxID=3420 RepID=UPI004062D103
MRDLKTCSSSLVLFFVVPLFLISVILLLLNPPISFWAPLPTSSYGLSSSIRESPVEIHAKLVGFQQDEKRISSSDSSSYFNLSSSPKQDTPLILQSDEKGKVLKEQKKKKKKKKKNSWEIVEAELARARASIREAARNGNGTSDPDYVPQGPIYRNSYTFHRSYREMEKVFKIFVYEEGEPPLFHAGPCKNIYSTEGRFIHEMEMGNQFRTRYPYQAHVHFLPFSVAQMVHYIYEPNSFNLNPLKHTAIDYIDAISRKYPYWNRSLGADHFMLSCHDWGPHVSSAIPHLYNNSIRVLCNANSSEGFNPSKDAALPEINLKTGVVDGLGGPSPSRRTILGFFAGGLHGPVRPILFKHWKGKDKDLLVYEYLPKEISYYDMMRKSRFCLCPSGYEVASPRIVEAIYAECVPVIIADHYVLPFSDVLNWKSFSIQLSSTDIPRLKEVLMGISPRQYIRMQRRVKQVQRHFLVNMPPKSFQFHQGGQTKVNRKRESKAPREESY